MADLLVADIGGTNARFAISDGAGALHEARTLGAANFPNLDEAITEYFAKLTRPKPNLACFAVACPAHGPVIKLTNSTWHFVKAEIAQKFGFDRFLVINDFEALGASVPVLKDKQLTCLREGTADPNEPSLVIGPGTGLGVGAYVPAGKSAWAVIAGEGGHVGLAPHTDAEVRLWMQLREKYGRVSAERALNGAGLVNIYAFVAREAGQAVGDIDAPEVSRRALADEDIAVKAVTMFFDLLGSTAGDLALAFGSRGGVYIGGGMTPKLLDFALSSNLVQRFMDKGRVSRMLAAMPIWVIMENAAALIGARRQFDREAS